jgi:membrane associated rhomboid family serine protease
LGGIISGALFWLAINIRTEFSLIGASAGLMALLIYFCQTYPDKSLTLLLFFFLPITLRAKWIGYGLWLYEILQCLFQEIPQLSTIASSAHLGGMVFGLLFFKAKMWLESQPATPKKEFKGHYTVHLGF